MSNSLSAVAVQDFQINGSPALGAKLFMYSAGTTTKITTYIDSGGVTTSTNPIIMNSRGEPQNSMGASVGIWVPSGILYKMVFAAPTDSDPPTNPIWTVDNISSTPGSSSSVSAIISASGSTMVAGGQYGFKTSAGAFSASLPLLSTVTPGSSIMVYDIDNNAATNNITILAQSGDTIADYGTTAASSVMNVNNLTAEFFANSGGWRVQRYATV